MRNCPLNRTHCRRWACQRLLPPNNECLVKNPLLEARRAAFIPSSLLHGMGQLEDVPLSTDRKPRGFHRGPGKRQTSDKEASAYRFIKKWDLQMRESWDPLEPFQGLPKPKKQLGNEATEIIWPYCVLLERVVKVHPFTKSIYVYYSRWQSTERGKWAAKVAQSFSHGYLIPITFHNSHVYVETELLVEYSETPWIVIHTLDGRHRVLPVRPADRSATTTPASAAAELLKEVVQASGELGASTKDPKGTTQLLNERPLQNQYVRVDYQWYGDTPEERASHLVKWDFEPRDVEPVMRSRNRHVMDWLNFDGRLPTAAAVHANVRREQSRLQAPRTTGGPTSFFNARGARANARHSRFGSSS